MKKPLLALALAAVLPFTAQASELSYTYVEADYLNLDHGVDGWGLRGSADIGKTGLYALGRYGRLDADGTASGDVRSNELGVGYHHTIAAKADLLGELAYRNADTGSSNIDGMRASVGVRGQLANRVEGFAKANYYDRSDYHGDVTGTLGGQFKVTDTWGATAEAELGNGERACLLGVRASF